MTCDGLTIAIDFLLVGVSALGAAGASGKDTPTCFGKKVTIPPGAGTIIGTDGNDVIVGSDGSDVIEGNGGDDLICALGGNDMVTAGLGDDKVDLGAGDDARARGSLQRDRFGRWPRRRRALRRLWQRPSPRRQPSPERGRDRWRQ